MQPLRIEMNSGAAFLFVRDVSDLPSALRMVNDLLARRRSGGSPGDAVLGIHVGTDPDTTLHELARTAAGVSIGLRESVGLSGIWSLCWFDSPLARSWRDAGDRRRHVLDTLLHADLAPVDAGESSCRRVLFPVVTRAEAGDEIDVLIDTLASEYPALQIMREAFLHDPMRGGVVRLECAGEAPNVA